MGWRRLTVDGGRQTVFDLCLCIYLGFKGLRATAPPPCTQGLDEKTTKTTTKKNSIRRRQDTRGKGSLRLEPDSLLVQRLRLATTQQLPPTKRKDKQTHNAQQTFACGWRPRIASLFDSQRSRGFVMLVVETRQLLSAPITRRIFFNRPLPGPLRTNPPACLISIPP